MEHTLLTEGNFVRTFLIKPIADMEAFFFLMFISYNKP